MDLVLRWGIAFNEWGAQWCEEQLQRLRSDANRELTEPSFRGILRGGMPGFLREGFLPLAVFYVGWRLWGTGGHRAPPRRPLLVYGTSGGSAATGSWFGSPWPSSPSRRRRAASHSATAYLATPVVANAIWGLAFLGSVAVRRPLAGALACAWYPFPPAFRESRSSSGSTASSRSSGASTCSPAARCGSAVLLAGNVTGFLVVVFVTGAPRCSP